VPDTKVKTLCLGFLIGISHSSECDVNPISCFYCHGKPTHCIGCHRRNKEAKERGNGKQRIDKKESIEANQEPTCVDVTVNYSPHKSWQQFPISCHEIKSYLFQNYYNIILPAVRFVVTTLRYFLLLRSKFPSHLIILVHNFYEASLT
jgi:hypothetical protein